MPGLSNFALRVPPRVKAAAKALTNVAFYEMREPDEEHPRLQRLSSINEAFVFLMYIGLKPALAGVERKMDEWQKEYKIHKVLTLFFMDNPRAKYVRPQDLVEGSVERAWVEEYVKDMLEQDDDARPDTDPTEYGPGKQSVSWEFANIQANIAALTDAREALLLALESDWTQMHKLEEADREAKARAKEARSSTQDRRVSEILPNPGYSDDPSSMWDNRLRDTTFNSFDNGRPARKH